MVEVEDLQYPPPPYNLTLYKGIKSYRLPRQFVTFLLNHPVARDYIDWVMFIAHAEEHTVATLARISNITRNYNGEWLVTQNREPQVQFLQKLARSSKLKLSSSSATNWFGFIQPINQHINLT